MPTHAAILLLVAVPLAAQDPKAVVLALSEHVPWQTDGEQGFEGEPPRAPVKIDRGALVDAACRAAKQQQKLVLWYVPRIIERELQGRQMYRAPVLDIYAQQVLFADPDVAELLNHAFVPLRCVCDQALSDRFGLRPLEVVEPAVVFLDGDGRVVHFVERLRTFHGQWFADLCRRVIERHGGPTAGTSVDELRKGGRWRAALAVALRSEPKQAADWLAIARLHRLLREPAAAARCAEKAGAAGAPAGEISAELGLIHLMQGNLAAAQPLLEQAWRSSGSRAAEAGYWQAWAMLRRGDETGAMRRFQLVAQRFPDQLFGRRASANSTLGPDDRPLGAAFTGFEAVAYLPDAAYEDDLPRDTTWRGAARPAAAMARDGVAFLLQQQRDDGGFADARYAYWPDSTITPNVWVAITALCCAALFEHRDAAPELRPGIDRALRRGEDYLLDPKRLNRGANEDCYADAYRLLYLSRRAAAEPAERAPLGAAMDSIVAATAARQHASGFWAHEYENAFATAAVVLQLLAARDTGIAVADETLDRAAAALVSSRLRNGAFVYSGAAADRSPTGLKDSSGRMPVCEGALLRLGRSDLERVRFAMATFWAQIDRLERVRRNDFHSDGELGGFFFFHSVFHASEAVRLLPDDERAAHWPRFLGLLQRIPEVDGSWIDSHELGRSYGTAMALLTLANAARE